ncbi:hypothetical protein SDA92_01025 [Legionella pneumophila serogroup 1]
MQKTARRKGIVFIIISYIILSADEPVVAKLIQLGNNFTIHGRNPISFLKKWLWVIYVWHQKTQEDLGEILHMK